MFSTLALHIKAVITLWKLDGKLTIHMHKQEVNLATNLPIPLCFEKLFSPSSISLVPNVYSRPLNLPRTGSFLEYGYWTI